MSNNTDITLRACDVPVRPPRSWKAPATHYLRVLEDPWYRLIAEVTDAFTNLTVDFWRSRGVRNLHLPLTTGSISSPLGLGSDSSPVAVTVGGVKTNLADSMQFMLEFGCRLFPSGCYYVMPSFRGEDADPTHLSQFFHSEAEICAGLGTLIGVIEDYLAFLARGYLNDMGGQIRRAAGQLDHVEAMAAGIPFEQVTFDEAEQWLGSDPELIRYDERGFRVLTRAGEQRLISQASGAAIWVTGMDHLSVPFYQAFADKEGLRAKSADLLFGVGETVGAGERHAGADTLDRALAIHQVKADDYTWYRTMKERFPLQTSGFGMGVERFLLWLLGHDDIRDIPLVLRFNGQSVQP